MHRHYGVPHLKPGDPFSLVDHNAREFMSQGPGHRDQGMTSHKSLEIGPAGEGGLHLHQQFPFRRFRDHRFLQLYGPRSYQDGQKHDQDPVKYKSVYTGLELNAGFYSRNREINPESSFSVNG